MDKDAIIRLRQNLAAVQVAGSPHNQAQANNQIVDNQRILANGLEAILDHLDKVEKDRVGLSNQEGCPDGVG